MTDRIAWFTVTCALLSLFAAAHPNLDPDMWWHLAVGEEILRHRTVYFADPFSFTQPAVWVNAQWLSEVVFALVHRRWGVLGLEFAAMGLKVIAFLVVYATMDAPSLTRVWVTLLFGFGALPAMGGARPQLVSYLLLALLAYGLWRCHTDAEWARRYPLVLPPLFMTWANVHSFYPIGFALLGAVVLADAWNERAQWQPALGARWRRDMVFALTASLVAMCCTPFGWKSPWQVLVNIAQSSHLPIEEWKPITAIRHPLVYLWAFLVLLWIAGAAWSSRRMDAWEFLWGALLTIGVVSGVRMVGVWCLLMAPFVARHISAMLLHARSDKAPPSWLPQAIALCCAWLAICVLVLRFSPAEFEHKEWREYPKDAVLWMQRNGVVGNCLTRYDWGGYVAWRTQGRIRVFVDGRADFYSRAVMSDFLAAYGGAHRWRQVLDRYGVTLVLAPPDAPIVNLLRLCPHQWQVRYRDSQAVVLQRVTAICGCLRQTYKAVGTTTPPARR
ncbi:hypothetical protein HRbin17_02762 [bacterium HR17]|uniref:Glycosyltransferase RgtA/B/C/D-like domain-containing protein n=1 Tax=Candidatus Fervidibacter japonicus TaxID=2035412 RepID=A0A2H5XGA9_9BACT|nr:hypothetical protein HRbin17_02762 [bacterium HR17]